jgi:hypothetical protein
MWRSEGAIPSVDAAAFRRARRRTLLLRGALAVAMGALLATAVLAARELQAPAENIIPQGRSGVIVFDLSRSIGAGPAGDARRALLRLDAPDQRFGLVVFSDTAYPLLAPGSPGVELRPILHFFTPIPGRKRNGDPVFPTSPWDDTFRAGTQISVGLAAGAQALRRARITNGALLLVSDLADQPDDLRKLVPLVLSLQRRHVAIRILALNPRSSDRALFARLVGKDAFVGEAPSLGLGGALHGLRTALTKPLPWSLVGLSLALLLALGLNELLCGRLTVEAAR